MAICFLCSLLVDVFDNYVTAVLYIDNVILNVKLRKILNVLNDVVERLVMMIIVIYKMFDNLLMFSLMRCHLL